MTIQFPRIEFTKDLDEMVKQGTSPLSGHKGRQPHFALPTPQNAEREKRSQRPAVAGPWGSRIA
jgi:hypothetical protein